MLNSHGALMEPSWHFSPGHINPMSNPSAILSPYYQQIFDHIFKMYRLLYYAQEYEARYYVVAVL